MKRSQQFWDEYFLKIAEVVSSASKDPSVKVGAVVVDKNNRIAGTGYNGFPRGVEDSEENYNNREFKYPRVVHAEVNAVLDAGERAEESKLYVHPPFALPNICSECCKIAIQAGIIEVISYKPNDESLNLSSRWGESIKISREMCEQSGIKWRAI